MRLDDVIAIATVLESAYKKYGWNYEFYGFRMILLRDLWKGMVTQLKRLQDNPG